MKNLEKMSKEEIKEYEIAYRLIRKLINTNNEKITGIKSGARNSFSIVQNYLANVIADHYAEK